MEENFYDNDLEKFLQQQVKHHRMYPSDAVWKGIYKQMHGNRRWPGLYFFAIIMIAALTIGTLFIESEEIVYSQPTVAKATALKYDQLDPAEITEQTIRNISSNNASENNNSDKAGKENMLATRPEDNIPLSRPSQVAVTYNELSANNTINTELINIGVVVLEETPATLNTVHQAATVKTKKSLVTVPGYADEENKMKNGNPTDTYLQEHPEEADRILQQQVRVKPNRWQLQFYIAPSMNYREIVDQEMPSQPSGGPVANNYNVNAGKLIRYQPGLGIEFGVGALYNVNNRLKVKAAIQYNIRQYNIEAYEGTTELAKIALVRGGNVDTITAISRYRTTGVYGEAQLLNKYHQVSLPVGIEYSLFNSKRFGFNLGGTLQPTYTFSESSYLLTADYKSYADGKSILRRWNLNSSVEAMFTYKARNVQWRFGPQLRYQYMPNYTDAYPIKEYLIDYGFKIGFTKPIR